MEAPADQIEAVKAVVGRFFPIYEVRVRPEALAFHVHVDSALLDEAFEGLRQELKTRAYIPVLRLERGEHIIYVQQTPPRKFRGLWLNVTLLVATVASTIYAGMLLWSSTYGQEADLYSLGTIGNAALYFALPLMVILGTHEMAHYLMAKRHHVAASLPFFIPAPFTLLGTLGALISMREPIPNKRALMDIGISGPLAGLAVAFPVTLLGLYMNATNPVFGGPNTGGGLGVNLMPLFQAMVFLIPIPNNALFHPTAFAGWVGFFVTALNLLPAGQLDGGHVARALLGNRSRYLSYGAFFALLGLGFFFFPSWLLLAFLVFILGLRHPPPLNDVTQIHVGRKSLGLAVLVILVLSFVPQPLVTIPVTVDGEFRSWPDGTMAIVADEVTLDANDSYVYKFHVNNTGNVETTYELELRAQNLPGWNISFTRVGEQLILGDNLTVTLNATEDVVAIVLIKAPMGIAGGQTFDVEFTLRPVAPSASPREPLVLSIHT